MVSRKSLIVWGGVMVVILAVAGRLIMGKGTLPGEGVADLGRDHLGRDDLEKTGYNSNPPTSGPHDPDWIRPGIYQATQDKYKLIHSLEHGYVVVHYNCALPISSFQFPVSNKFSIDASAHEDEGDLDGDSTPSAEASPSSDLNPDASCPELVGKLAGFAKKVGVKKLVVQPNGEIEKPVVLTAWNRILKMEKWDEEAAAKFVKAFRNKGPEATME